MLIDFHVHTFPDAIAERTCAMLLENMTKTYNIDQKLNYDGTVDGLLRSMNKTGVDISVIMPIATKPSQHKSINNFAKLITNDKIISFGSLHPYGENLSHEINDLRNRGFKGIKLHPDYQGVCADDDKFISLVKTATENGLYVTIHSGHDTGIKPPFKGSIDKIKTLLNKVDDCFVFLAHMGAFNQWDMVEDTIINSNAYFDTSVVSRFINVNQYRRIIDKHGADRILFGSDMPWELPSDTLKFLESSGISKYEIELITYKNANNILKIF